MLRAAGHDYLIALIGQTIIAFTFFDDGVFSGEGATDECVMRVVRLNGTDRRLLPSNRNPVSVASIYYLRDNLKDR